MTELSSPVTPGVDACAVPLSPRSQLVSDFFDHMNRQNIPWVVMNNYEELPWVIPSDIDFSIPPALFYRLDAFIGDFARETGTRIVQKLWHGNMKCAYILACGPERSQEFVQLDFFTAFSTKGCPALIPHDDLVAERRALRNFHVPQPEVELIFTAMRRLFKDDWSARHCARISKLRARIFDIDWLPARYGWMSPTLEAAIRGDADTVAARRVQDWERLRETASGNLSVLEKFANASLQTRRIVARLRDETGQLIVLTAPRDSISADALEALGLIFHRRLFLTGPTQAGLTAKLALLKRRKGLIFVLAGPDHPKGQALAQYLGRMGLVDQVLYPEGDSGADPAKLAKLAGLKAPATAFASDADAIEAIVQGQEAKTAKAIARGGTQTSGAAA